MMWFGNSSSGSNLNWRGFLCWTELPEAMIVVSAQFTDWGETSARQAIELTEYFIDNFSVDENRVYASGYSAGGIVTPRSVRRLSSWRFSMGRRLFLCGGKQRGGIYFYG